MSCVYVKKNEGIVMKIGAVFVLLLSLVSTYAEAINTSVPYLKEPGTKQLKIAVESLMSAMDTTDPKLKSHEIGIARSMLKKSSAIKKFKAGFYCKRKKMFIGKNVKCDYELLGKVCYKGEAKDALKLLKFALFASRWGSKETYTINPRIKDNKLIATWYSAPNEYEEDFEIKKCN